MGYKKQNGFTLVELLVVVALIGILSGAAAMTFGVVMNTSTLADGQNRALGEVHMAGSWISRDMKDVVYGTALTPTEDNTLCEMECYVGTDFERYIITYTIDVDKHLLTRSSRPKDFGTPAENLTVARYVVGPGDVATYLPGDATTLFYHAVGDRDWYYTLSLTADYSQSGNSAVTKIYKVMRGYSNN